MRLSFLVVPATSEGAELKEETLNAWDAYIQKANSEMMAVSTVRFSGSTKCRTASNRVRAGNILVSPVGQHNPKPVPSGLIHDWIGAAFIPDATLEDVLSVARDYSH